MATLKTSTRKPAARTGVRSARGKALASGERRQSRHGGAEREIRELLERIDHGLTEAESRADRLLEKLAG